MQVQVSGRHVDVGDALRTRISDELLSAIGKYFERGGDADVVLTRDGHGFRIDCSVTLASGQQLQMVVNNCSATCTPGIYFAGSLK